VNADDQRLGELFRLLRRQQGLTQEQVAASCAIPVREISLLESGAYEQVAFGRIRRLFAEVDGKVRISVWWKGAAADRLLDERHAALGERAARVMARLGWQLPFEVTYSKYGERGSIDIFGHRKEHRAVAVCEVKSAFGSLEELNRSMDTKVRLAPGICSERFGWTPIHVAKLLIVPEVSTMRRVVENHRQTMDQLYPARSREIRAWLRQPDTNIGAIWFLSDPRNTRMGSLEAV
jgi:transcriptional regulator with XRE-family HTH domain